MGMAAMALGGAGASAAGGMLGNSMMGGGGGSDPQKLYDAMSQILTAGRDQALGYSQNYTNQAVGQQNTSLTAANQALQDYLSKATGAAQGQAQGGLQTFQNLQAPFAQGGYNAYDSYLDSLGMSRPQMGSAGLVGALQGSQLAQQLKGMGPATALGAAPVAPTLAAISAQVTPDQVSQWMQGQHTVGAGGRDWYTGGIGGGGNWGINTAQALQDPRMRSIAQGIVAQNQFDAANKAYQTQNTAYQNAQNQQQQQLGLLAQLNAIGYNPSMQNVANAYQQGLFSRGQ